MIDLRVASAKRGHKIKLFVNGKSCVAYEGETVHAALIAAGYRFMRKSRQSNQLRGAFCGMGICYDCQVTINGVPNQRACMIQVADRMEIAIDE